VGVGQAALGCLFLLAVGKASAQENVIHVQIGGVRNDDGRLMCALFSSADRFPKSSEKPSRMLPRLFPTGALYANSPT